MNVTLKDLDFSYEAKNERRTIFRKANMEFQTGNFYALMGPSGSGKTTLFRLLNRELEPTQGQIEVLGRSLSTIDIHELRSSIVGRIFQDYLLIPFLNPVENLLLAKEISTGKSTKQDREHACALLEQVGLSTQQSSKIESLSGGEQQRVAIARALMGSPKIFLADEPTGALDRKNTFAIAKLLQKLAHEQNVLVIAGTHDYAFAEFADAVINIVDNGLVLG